MVRRLALLACLLVAAPAAAKPFPAESVPPALAPWIPWVLDEAPDRNCVSVDGDTVCAWPGRLALDLGPAGGTFALDAQMDKEGFLRLPGDAAHWPQAVTLGEEPVAVVARDGRPAVLLPPGEARLKGRFAWKALPESIPIPAEAARVDLVVEGKPIPFPRRDGDLLWVQARAGGDQDGDRLDLEVYRKIEDGVPVRVTTRLVLRASGKPREVDLGRVLLDGTVPLSVAGDVPARFDAEGGLHVQVRAGTFNLEAVARTDGTAPASFAAPKRPEPWPPEEVWVWQANDALRQVTLSGPPGVEPARTGLRDDWKRLPAYMVAQGAALEIRTARRGEPEPPPGALTLERDVWMDTDGGGFTLRDRIRGSLTSGWRLDLAEPAVLGHVAVGGQDQLVTTPAPATTGAAATGPRGVELRDGAVNVVAESRIDGRTRTLPAVGWAADVQKLSIRLHLAPGWSLLTARGVDDLPGTWISGWTLLGFLFVLLVALAVARLTRWYWGLLALIALVLNHQEAARPFWVWVALVAGVALLRVVPAGRLRSVIRWAWGAVVVVAVVSVVPFLARQVRTGLYPQVAQGLGLIEAGLDTGLVTMSADVNVPETANAPAPARAVDQEAADKTAVLDNAKGPMGGEGKGEMLQQKEGGKFQANAWSYRTMNPRKALQNDPNAVVQTGPGVPAWTWKSWRLGWSGPVDRGHQVTLWLLSPAVNLALAFLRVALTLVLAGVLVRRGMALFRGVPGGGGGGTGAGAAAAVAACLLAALSLPGAARAAEVPDRAVLDDLRARLTRPEACQPDCTSTSRVDLAVRGGQLTLKAEVHAIGRADWSVPGPASNWVPASVSVDGRPGAPMALLKDGFLHVRLAGGRHLVEVSGPLPAADSLMLEFGDEPRRVEAEVEGWRVEGLREDGRAERSIQLLRLSGSETASAAGEPGAALPPWLEVERTLDVGIPWLVHTVVRRVSPTGSPVLVRVPLLAGESVTESELRVEGGQVVVSLGRDDTEIGWESTLQEQPRLALTAPKGVPWSETWILKCSPVWACRTDGLAPVRHQAGGRWEPMFRPYPGESLQLALERPLGAAGQSITIDQAVATFVPGTRMMSATLRVVIRSSQGGVQTLELPDGAKVRKLSVDDRDEPIRMEGARLGVTLKTGSQRIVVEWQQPGGIGALFEAPRVGLGAAAVNAQVVVELPHDRWLLLAGGPSWGPAVLFWGLLVAALLAAFVLGRVRLSPLRTWQWALLACGLVLVPIPAAVVVIGWFLAMAWRGSRPPPGRAVAHDGLQLVLAGWTVAAMACLYAAVHTGLLVQPDMQVSGAGSGHGHLVWFADRVGSDLPRPWVLSLPRWAWQAVMLAWSLWLAWSLVKWLPWAWRAFSNGGLWTRLRRPKAPRKAPAPAPAPSRDETGE